jgi:cbb3-type cytochrome oxidase maturation protein
MFVHETIKIMSALYLLIGISLLVAIGFLFAFLWAMKKGQYEDDYTPSVRMLFDNELITKEPKTNKK